MEEYTTSRGSYGLLITPDIKLHRQWFKELVRLQGIITIHKPVVKEEKHYNEAGELVTTYLSGEKVGCIFDEHPTQWTTKRLGWVSEMQEDASIIHVPYDLKGLEIGSLFLIPSGFDNTTARLSRVVKMGAPNMIYPASIACKIIPEYEDDFDASQNYHIRDNGNLLIEEDDL